METYLASTKIIDWETSEIMKKAHELAQDMKSRQDIAKACFEYVRDEIRHSSDFRLNPVTCKASDVLRHKTGFCYAKSHLLAALLRANGLPAGLCYQRLTIEKNRPPFCLHGLNAVHLPDVGWYRIDARGNTAEIKAEFTPPKEKIAFPIIVAGEADFQEIWPEPLPEIIRVLQRSATFEEVAENLPDIEILMGEQS